MAEIQAQHPDRRIEVYFEDEARFGQQGTLTRVWARRGSRPSAVRQTQYQYAWVLSAVAPATGAAEGLVSPRLNTEVINIFLRQFSRRLPADVHAALVWDGAGYHQAHALQTPENITILKLPPYSPELNPVENLWHYLKSHYWSNRLYADYEALVEAAQHAWQAVCLVPPMIQSICRAAYACDASS